MLDYPVGREPVQIVEILQPFCENVFGVSPCTATGTNDTKCYNTRATCQDTANFALGTPLSLYFTKGYVPSDLLGLDYVFPCLTSVSTSPTKANLSGANSDAKGIGNRALCTIKFKDFQHTDRLVDPYISGRSWNPLDADRGSFWSRWQVRNKYRTNIQVKIYEGYVGQTLSQMSVRLYFMTGISKQSTSGDVTMQCKDILARIEERQAQVPAASPGLLFRAINESQTSFEVANAVEADYDASGTLRIGDELMTYTARATSTNGIEFTGVSRGSDNTSAVSHGVDTAVQQCVRYTEDLIIDGLVDLLETRGGIPSAFMTDLKPGGASYLEAELFLSYGKLTRVITEPTAIADLIAEMSEQFQFIIWWEETEQLIKLRAIRGYVEVPDTLTEEANIISGTFEFKDKPRERASQVWVYYIQRDYTQDASQPSNYKEQYVVADLESETDELYGSPSIRKMYGSWISQTIIATSTGHRISVRYNDVPVEATLRVDIKDGDYQIGDNFFISHHLDVDQYGQRNERLWLVTSREEVVPNEIVEYIVEDTTIYGRFYFIMASGSSDYDPFNVPFKSAYIGNASGVLSDGTTAARIG